MTPVHTPGPDNAILHERPRSGPRGPNAVQAACKLFCTSDSCAGKTVLLFLNTGCVSKTLRIASSSTNAVPHCPHKQHDTQGSKGRGVARHSTSGGFILHIVAQNCRQPRLHGILSVHEASRASLLAQAPLADARRILEIALVALGTTLRHHHDMRGGARRILVLGRVHLCPHDAGAARCALALDIALRIAANVPGRGLRASRRGDRRRSDRRRG